MDHPLDQALNDHYDGKCFFMNLGPTGIRARMDPDAPTVFKVMYVFQDAKSPARGKVGIGDLILGANGKRFVEPHTFHRTRGRGWRGPPLELARAIEDSQGGTGQLDLLVQPGGDAARQKTVSLQLKPVGRFAATWPWHCPRSERLRADLCDFLFENGLSGRHHTQVQTLLALWASGDRRAEPLVAEMARKLKQKRADPKTARAFQPGAGATPGYSLANTITRPRTRMSDRRWSRW